MKLGRTHPAASRLLIVLRCAAIAVTLAVGYARDARADEPTRFAADRPLDCLHIKLALHVDLESKRVAGVATIDLVTLRETSTITFNAVDFETSVVKLSRADGPLMPAYYRNDGRHIELSVDPPLAMNEAVRVEISYLIDNPGNGLHFYGPTENEPDVPRVMWSQGQSTDNRYWFPSFDHPNEQQTTEIIVTTDDAFQISSNGRLVSRTLNPGDGTVTVHWLQDKPHVSYLVSLIVGEFHVETETWRGKPVEYWVHPAYAEQIDRSFRNTTRMLDFFSDSLGVDYPWDRYAQICCEGFGGGMENTSATTLGNRTLYDERGHLDANADDLIAHELAHQWFGDLLTCRDWAHLWLNEGFATYFEALWDEYDLGPEAFSYNMYRKGLSAIRGGKKRPVVDRAYPSPDSMFDSRAYPKGAWVAHMIRRRLGDEMFWKVLNAYLTAYAHQSVETVDLRQTIESLSGRSFERFFYDWTDRPGSPDVLVSTKWLNEEGLAKITIRQKQDDAAFHFPLKLVFGFDDGPTVTVNPEITTKEETFYYPLPAAPTMVSVDPDQAVLMTLDESKGRDLWRAQLLRDPNVAARVRAAVHFGESKADRDRKLLAEALESERFWGVRRAVATALGKSGGDIARDALLAGLQLDDHRARRTCVEQLRTFREDPLVIATLGEIVRSGDPSYNVEAAAIESYARLQPDDGLAMMKTALGRDSRREVIRVAALSGLGQLADAGTVDLLCVWTASDKPRLARPAAIRSLARVSRETHLDDTQMQEVVATLSESLNDTGRRVRGAAADALGRLGDPAAARAALPALEAVAANDSSDRVRRSARRSADAITAGKPAPVQLTEVRDELRSLIKENEKLSDRVEKLESMGNGAASN